MPFFRSESGVVFGVIYAFDVTFHGVVKIVRRRFLFPLFRLLAVLLVVLAAFLTAREEAEYLGFALTVALVRASILTSSKAQIAP